MNEEEAKANEEIRAKVQAGRGCLWAMVATVGLLTLGCVGWVLAQAFEAWKAAL